MRRLLVPAVAGLLLVPSAASAQDAPQRATPQERGVAPGAAKPTLRAALDAVGAERAVLPAGTRKLVDARLRTARARAASDPCAARTALRGARQAVDATRGATGGDVARARMNVAAATLQAETLLLVSSRTAACGGGKAAPQTRLRRAVSAADAKGLTLTIGNPVPRFDAKTLGQRSFVDLRMEGLATQGIPGRPALPASTHLIVVPEGASVRVTPQETSAITLDAVDLAPAQEEPADQAPGDQILTSRSPELATPPFRLDAGAYGARRPTPARSFAVQPAGTIGGLRLVALSTPPARYVPGSKRLQVVTRTRLRVDFVGGTTTFGDQRLVQPANRELADVLAANTVNFPAAVKGLKDLALPPCGDDLLIITPPQLRPAADRLAAARNAKGISAQVFQTGTAPVGSTKEQIRSFIQQRVSQKECGKLVKYVVLLGDAELIPTWPLAKETSGEGIPSDLPYSQPSLTFFLPNVALGRIPAGTLEQANVAVDKQVAYTDVGPQDPGFSQRATVAGFFQVAEDCDPAPCEYPNGKARESRRYMTSITRIRTGLRAFGKTVDTYVSRDPESTPVLLNDGSLLPADLIGQAPYSGTGTQIRDAIDQGRWLVVHRDHAGPGGWGDPSFGASTVSTLTNGTKLPLVLSINCSSGAFDQAGQGTFTDAFMFNPNGGAVGVLAATRNTPSFTNEEFARPLVDALTGGKVLGGSFTPLRRVSSVLLHGKLALLTKTFDATVSAGQFRNMLRLYHYFGDPSVQIRN